MGPESIEEALEEGKEEMDDIFDKMMLLLMVVGPAMLSIQYTIVHVSRAELVTAIVCGGGAIAIYFLSRSKWKWAPDKALIAALAVIALLVFPTSIKLGVDGENPFEYYFPYMESISAWAVPTIMWYEVRSWLTNTERVGDISIDTIETIGFAVALIYTAFYTMFNLYGSGAGGELFLGFFVSWVGVRLILQHIGP